MNYLTRLSRFWTLLFSVLLICVTGYAQTKNSTGTGGSVSGHVKLRGKPASGIIIVAGSGGYGPQQGPTQKATTDQDGNYKITDLPPGTYSINPVAGSYVSVDHVGRGNGIVLADNEAVENINFTLVPGGVVTGKVTDADGRVLTEERVYLVPETSKESEIVRAGPSGQTDDRGIYRIFGVRAGRYKVTIGSDERAFFENVISGRQTYQQTYYPDVVDAAKASIVEVGEGTEATNIDITVGRLEQTFSASGLLTDESGQPVPGVRFGLRKLQEGRPDSGLFVGTNSLSNTNGEFRFENLMPGKYTAFMFPQMGGDVFTDGVPFEITDQDVTGLLMKAQKGASISGFVEFESANDKTLLAKFAQIRLQVSILSLSPEPRPSFGQASVINSDLRFRVAGLQAGKAVFHLGSTDPMRSHGFSIIRVERYGIVQGLNIEVQAGEQISGVKVVVGYGSGSVRGAVKIENGTLPAASQLHLRITRPGDRQPAIRSPDIDARGHFLIEGLMPGVYDLMVRAFLGTGGERTVHQQIIVGEGMVTDVSMVLDLKATDPRGP